ncbi:RepB family plasmid replication initiator protein [Thiothrix unzii]|uniref:RepB family plasmid replication initiator protein n=2 Tax=Thiothrix unzii TaxID=111769 RepID=A0A975IJ62_9GAMM|nr:RepB family plasmid replication initiator protein [Thiothrix unzii]QTR55488.1 RepB family plasmid replication initiator protein [Thiothrix unzii]
MKELKVVKSNRLVEASYRLTEIEHQIILYAICRSRNEGVALSPDHPLTIRAVEFAQQFGTNPAKVYGQLKTAMDTLFSRHLVIHDIDEETGKPEVIKIRWINEASYVDGSGNIKIVFSRRIIPYISQLEIKFTPYLLKQISKMTSVHAIRIYELLAQYVTYGKREISIDWLKNTLQLEGEYPRIYDLKERVIDVAVDQINKYSDINVNYTNIKTGRAITGFLFTINKTKPKIDEAAKVENNNTDFKTLLAFVPDAHRAKKSVIAALESSEKKHGFDYVKRNILYSNANAAKSYAGFLNSALKQDWGHDLELEQKEAIEGKQTVHAAEKLNKMAAELRELAGEIKSLQHNSKLTHDAALWNQAETLKQKYFALETLYQAAKQNEEVTNPTL